MTTAAEENLLKTNKGKKYSAYFENIYKTKVMMMQIQ